MRLNKYIARSGVASRRKAEELISQKKILINGQVILDPAYSVKDNDVVSFEHKEVLLETEFYYLILNKPKGCTTTLSDEHNRKTVMDYLKNFDKNVFPIGRLDYNSEGLLLFTNDGDLAYKLMHPKYQVPKIYHVVINGNISVEEIEMLKHGVNIDGSKAVAKEILFISKNEDKTKLHVTVTEGRNRLVRKLFNVIGKEVIFLKRIGFGSLKLGGLGRGKYRHLREKEILELKKMVSIK